MNVSKTWQKFIVAHGDRFEESEAEMMYCFAFLRTKVIAKTF
jgi:hypothetical protein